MRSRVSRALFSLCSLPPLRFYGADRCLSISPPSSRTLPTTPDTQQHAPVKAGRSLPARGVAFSFDLDPALLGPRRDRGSGVADWSWGGNQTGGPSSRLEAGVSCPGGCCTRLQPVVCGAASASICAGLAGAAAARSGSRCPCKQSAPPAAAVDSASPGFSAGLPRLPSARCAPRSFRRTRQGLAALPTVGLWEARLGGPPDSAQTELIRVAMFEVHTAAWTVGALTTAAAEPRCGAVRAADRIDRRPSRPGTAPAPS